MHGPDPAHTAPSLLVTAISLSALFLQDIQHPFRQPPHLAKKHPPTFAAGQGLAPHSGLRAVDGHVPDQRVAILAAVVHGHSQGKPVQGLSAVQPVGDVWWLRTRHLWRGKRNCPVGQLFAFCVLLGLFG